MAKRRLNYGLVIKLYKVGYTTKEIGRLLNINSGSVSKILHKEGIPTRPRGTRLLKEPLISLCTEEEVKATVYELVSKGVPSKVISFVVGVTQLRIEEWQGEQDCKAVNG